MVERKDQTRNSERVEINDRYILEPAIPLQIEFEETPLIFSETNSLTEWENQIESLTALPFNEDREKEIERQDHYFDAFAHRYKRDLRRLTRMRTQDTNTVMHSSAVFLEDRFEPSTDEKGQTFFESRKKAGKFTLNANGPSNVGGTKVTFSVLANTVTNKEGDTYTTNYPGYSFERKSLELLRSTDMGGAILAHLKKLLSWRVHDWLHAAILYDSKALSPTFKKWSDNSFFVKHLVKGDGRINYELLTTHLHFKVWETLFEKHATLKTEVIGEIYSLFSHLQNYENFLKNSGIPDDEAEGRVFSLAYQGTQALVNILPFNDEALLEKMREFPLFTKCILKLPKDTTKFLSLAYQDNLALPFRTNDNLELSIEVIIQEYIDGLLEEKLHNTQAWMIAELVASPESFAEIMQHVPESLRNQMTGLPIETYPIQILKYIGIAEKTLATPEQQAFWQALVEKTEIDGDGFFYLKVNQNEIDLAVSHEVIQQKTSVIFQIPYEHTDAVTLTIQRPETLLKKQAGATAIANPGDVVIFNCKDQDLAKKILNQSFEGEVFNAQKCISYIQKLAETSEVELADMYPLPSAETAIATFDLEQKAAVTYDMQHRPLIKAGFYRTASNRRRAAKTGPISIDSGRNDDQRRHILQGAVVENHTTQTEALDIFPVHSKSFNSHYQTHWSELPQLQFAETWSEGFAEIKLDSDEQTKILDQYWQFLDTINTAVKVGSRSKPPAQTFANIPR